MLDIFDQDAFSVTTLTDALRELKYVPSYISSLGLFQETSVPTLDVAVEKDAEQNIFLVQSSPRGAPGQTFGRNRRSMDKLTIPHYQVDDAVMADEVQQVRQFGDEYATRSLIDLITQRSAEANTSFELTFERQRLELIKTGTLLDADGSVMLNMFTKFGENQPAEIDFDLDNANPTDGVLRKKCAALHRSMASTLDGLPFSGIVAFCGDAFYDDLIAHPEVRETYKGYIAAAALRQNYVSGSGQTSTFGSVDMFDIRWINYRSGLNVGIDTDKVHFVPMGVPGLFRTVYGPADYIETVNRPGQRLYAKQWRMPNDKGVNLEIQSNALHYVTRPRVLMRGKRT